MSTVRNLRRRKAGTLLTLLVLAGAATALGACNTTRGFGEDMSSAGHAVSNSAEKTQQGM